MKVALVEKEEEKEEHENIACKERILAFGVELKKFFLVPLYIENWSW